MLYVVKCESCNKQEEIMCPVAERNRHVCDVCGGRLIVQIQPVVSMWNCDCPTSSKGKQIQ